MYTKEMFLAACEHEAKILKHLHTKLDPKMLDYRPTPKQRSMQELLESLPVNFYVVAEALRTGNFDIFKTEVPLVVAAAHANFPASIDTELGRLKTLVQNCSDADLQKPVKTFFNSEVPFGSALVDFSLRFLTAYRMQLFLYLKSCGRTEMTTFNCWGGQDAPPKA